ncbi:hypothetical protein HYC85_004179 [Camellia sinensis]|uniref:Uncharacterized protein n=1 Tax=Camellia sinensis TaxID=4442 RepID=A0A7J7HXW8_CAMSI|nr:hypothetical protein HYC85_004179 [Camellia sinensis]
MDKTDTTKYFGRNRKQGLRTEEDVKRSLFVQDLGRETINKMGSEKDVKAPNLLKKEKEYAEKSHHHHHKETHGTSDDIDEDTPIDEVKGPNVFERIKEEIEAVVQEILPKK